MRANLKFTLTFGRVWQRLLPTFWRSEINVFLGQALTFGLKNLHTDFLVFANEQLEDALRSSQSLLIQEALNNKYDPIYRRIRLQNNGINAGAPPLYSFTIFAPGTADFGLIKKFVNRYKLPDRNFLIVSE